MMTLAGGIGLGWTDAARSILDLVDAGVASVRRTQTPGHVDGELVATPAIQDLPPDYRNTCIMASLGVSKSTPVIGHA